MTHVEREKQLLCFKWLPRVGPVLFVTIRGKRFSMAFFCHRIEERCIKVGNYTSFLCARCTGLVIGAALAIMLLWLNIPLPLFLSGLICLPLLIDGFTQLFNIRKSNNPLRLISGILFAIGIITLLL